MTLTMNVRDTAPIKYSHRGDTILCDLPVTLVAQIDTGTGRLLDIRWSTPTTSTAQIIAIDTQLTSLIGQTFPFPIDLRLVPWQDYGNHLHTH
jgi:hypothetical protein